MPSRNPSESSVSATKHLPPYTRQQKWLHWISAVVILWATVTGFMVVWMKPANPWRQFIDNFNPQITTVLIPVFLWRMVVAVRETSRHPKSSLSLGARMARYAHTSLYLFVTLVLASGALMMTHGVKLLGFIPLPQLIYSTATLDALFVLHRLFCLCLGALIALHVAAVVKHALSGASVLKRMT